MKFGGWVKLLLLWVLLLFVLRLLQLCLFLLVMVTLRLVRIRIEDRQAPFFQDYLPNLPFCPNFLSNHLRNDRHLSCTIYSLDRCILYIHFCFFPIPNFRHILHLLLVPMMKLLWLWVLLMFVLLLVTLVFCRNRIGVLQVCIEDLPV